MSIAPLGTSVQEAVSTVNVSSASGGAGVSLGITTKTFSVQLVNRSGVAADVQYKVGAAAWQTLYAPDGGILLPVDLSATTIMVRKGTPQAGSIPLEVTAYATGDTLAGQASAPVTGSGGTTVKVDGVPVATLDIDSTPATATSLGAIPVATATTKGDIIAGSAPSAVTRLGVGSNGQILSANSANPSGLGWINSPAGTFTKATDADPYYAPQWPAYVAPGAPHANSGQAVLAANQMRACRVVIPRTGKLRDVSVWVQTSSGNFIAAVYDLGTTTSTVRTKLWDSGSVAVGAAGYQIIGDPNLDVVQGQQLDLAVLVDNGTVSLGQTEAFSVQARNQLPAAFLPAAGGCLPKMGWIFSAGSFTIPATVSEGAATLTFGMIYLFARVS
jgi:hypothetical protein